MAIYRTNSFWDYIGQGIAGIPQAIAAKQQMDLMKAQEERAKTMFGYESAPYEMAGQIMQEKTPESTFIPNLMTGIGGQVARLPSKFNENQFALARKAVPGLESPTERYRRKRKEDIEFKLEELKVPKAEYEAGAATAQMPMIGADVRLARTEKLRPEVQKFADAYVAKQILASGGRLSGRTLPKLAIDAYGEFTSDPGRLTSLGVEGVSESTLRPLFDEAVKKAWDEQQKLDVETLRARAYMMGQGTQADKTPQLINSLTSMARVFEARVKEMNDNILDPGAMAAISDPNSPAAKAWVVKKNAMQNTANLLMAAGAGLGAGTTSLEDAQLLLRNAQALMTTEQPLQMSGQVPQGTQVFDDAAVVAEAQRYGPSRWRAWLNKGVKEGHISQDQATRVLLLLERRRNP